MKQARGFTLIEMAIVLVIVTILIGGLAMPLSAQIQARRIAETRSNMNSIRDALIGYAMSHTFIHESGETRHFLPCPDTDNDGQEEERNETDGSCPTTRGGLPWITLGVSGDDAWGNRYTYAVDKSFYSNNKLGFVSTPAASLSGLNIYQSASCTAPAVMLDVPVVVVSHGPQGRGALNKNGGTPLAPASVATDERQNLNIPNASLPCADPLKFVSHNPTEDFDDLVMWLSKYEIFNRVCPNTGCL